MKKPVAVHLRASSDFGRCSILYSFLSVCNPTQSYKMEHPKQIDLAKPKSGAPHLFYFRWKYFYWSRKKIKKESGRLNFFSPLGIEPRTTGSRGKRGVHSETLFLSTNLVLILILFQLFIDRSSIDKHVSVFLSGKNVFGLRRRRPWLWTEKNRMY